MPVGIPRIARLVHDSGRYSTLTIPVYADNHFAGKFVLHFGQPRAFTEAELEMAEIIALEVGLVTRSLQAQRMKAELAAMTVDELRAPLTAIIGGALLIKSGKGIPRALEMIERNARLQEKLIEELLSVAQIDAGKLEVQLENLDLAPLLTEVIDETQVGAAEEKTVIHFELRSPLMVHGDAQRLRLVFSNLLGNSVRCAAPNGEVLVNAVASDGFVRVMIVDDGIGISPEQLPHLFERFRQVHSSRERSYNGLGLGLAIVQDLVTMQGGAVTADSPGPGKGAQFCVRLCAGSAA
jgi:signal transduction histidine kinase